MKRITVLLFAMLLSLTLFGCTEKGGTNDSEAPQGKITCSATPQMYYEGWGDWEGGIEKEPIEVVIDGDTAEVKFQSSDFSSEVEGEFEAYFQIRLVGTHAMEAGYYVITPERCYGKILVSGPAAEEFMNEQIAMYDAVLSEDEADEEDRQYARQMKELFTSDSEKDVSDIMMSDGFDSVKILCRIDAKKSLLYEFAMTTTRETESMWTGVDARYLFDYNENGVMTCSRCISEYGEYYETFVEYDANGTMRKITLVDEGRYGEDWSKVVYTFDEQGNLMT